MSTSNAQQWWACNCTRARMNGKPCRTKHRLPVKRCPHCGVTYEGARRYGIEKQAARKRRS